MRRNAVPESEMPLPWLPVGSAFAAPFSMFPLTVPVSKPASMRGIGFMLPSSISTSNAIAAADSGLSTKVLHTVCVSRRFAFHEYTIQITIVSIP